MGQYQKALEYYEKSLKINIATLGEQHSSTGDSYNNIGLIYYSMGQYQKALEYHENSLKINIATIGERHSSTGDSYNNIGSVY